MSVWEVMLKHQVRPEQMPIDAKTLLSDCEAAGLKILDLRPGHIFAAAWLPVIPERKDPFDRMLLAQARAAGGELVIHDKAFARSGDDCVVLV